MQETGSVINMVLGQTKSLKPVVGMGVTEILWSDREPYEVIAVKDDRHITIRKYDYIRTDDNGMSECQEYNYISNPDGKIKHLFLTKKGVWRERIGKRELGTTRFLVGKAERYYDFSF